MADKRDVWVPLTSPKIEAKPKRISESDGFYIGPQLNERQLRDLATIQSLIKTGGDLSPYYRRSGDRKGDRLLLDRGIMHLHLGGPGSDALLYLVQFPDDVLLLCVDTHIHLEDIPPGKKLPFYQIGVFTKKLKDSYSVRSSALQAALDKLRRPKGE